MSKAEDTDRALADDFERLIHQGRAGISEDSHAFVGIEREPTDG